MNFQFFSTPKSKKFNYKPRFQKPENEEETQNDKEKRNDEFAVRLHESWEKRRKKKEPHSFPLKLVIWGVLIIIALLYLYRKFFIS